MATRQTSKEAAAAKFTLECQESLEEVAKGAQVTVLLRTKLKSVGDVAARAAFEALRGEQMATRRAELLTQVRRRYGEGPQFCKNLQDSRTKGQANLVREAPNAGSLWLADAVAVSGTTDEINDLARHEDVEMVDVNPTFKLPEILQTPLEDTPAAVDGSAWGLAKIRAPEVWGGYGRGDNVLVGHLDTGVDDTHPALAGKVDFFEEFDGLGSPVGSPVHDSGRHGTHTAGTIVGRAYNGVNIGAAPNARLASALVLPGGGGTFAQIVGGMQWAVGQNVHVINMSLGGQGYTTLWNLPVLNVVLSGVSLVCSIGNSGCRYGTRRPCES